MPGCTTAAGAGPRGLHHRWGVGGANGERVQVGGAEPFAGGRGRRATPGGAEPSRGAGGDTHDGGFQQGPGAGPGLVPPGVGESGAGGSHTTGIGVRGAWGPQLHPGVGFGVSGVHPQRASPRLPHGGLASPGPQRGPAAATGAKAFISPKHDGGYWTDPANTTGAERASHGQGPSLAGGTCRHGGAEGGSQAQPERGERAGVAPGQPRVGLEAGSAPGQRRGTMVGTHRAPYSSTAASRSLESLVSFGRPSPSGGGGV